MTGSHQDIHIRKLGREQRKKIEHIPTCFNG